MDVRAGVGPVVTWDAQPDELIAQVRGGDQAALGRLLELYRNYLRLVARSLIGAALRVKLEPSDLVQETFLKAHREFARFAGHGEHELVAWLRRILARTLADQVKHQRRKGRDYRRQESLDLLLERSDQTLRLALASPSGSPSERASRREQAVLLADAVSQLPPDYREAFILRTLEHVPFEEIADKMGRSVGAVRMLWTRALERLNQMLEKEA
jgi:RNA polymerase sigma-70 factor (ECF subfamily)